MIKVLSIDGGGIRGIIPAIILSKIEELTETHICNLFDIIAGTSTGGILALALSMPSDSNNSIPKYSASDLVNLYSEKGSKIFDNNIFQKVKSFDGVFDEKYNKDGIENILKEYFMDFKLSDCITDVIIPAYETELRRPFFFKSSDSYKVGYDFFMWEIARATSAAPTYFEPYKIQAKGLCDYYSLIDGGVFANNPSLCAYIDAKKHHLRKYKEAEKNEQLENNERICVVSMGTGQLTKALRYNTIKNWGLSNWAQAILDVVFDGTSDNTHYQLSHLLNNDDYFRFQPSLAQLGNDRMDDASDRNIHELKLLSMELIGDLMHSGTMQRLINTLLDSDK